MSDIQIDIPDITVIVNPSPQYVSNINLPSIVPITDGNYYSIADFAVTAQTASYALNAQGGGFPYSGSAEITGSLAVTGTISANQLIVTNLISGSIIYESGSTKFGNSADDTHQFTGSMSVSGSITGVQFIGQLLGTASIANSASLATNAISASIANSASLATNAISASYIDGGYY